MPLRRPTRRPPAATSGTRAPLAAPGSPAPDLARAAWGAACLLAPGPVGRALAGHEPDARARRVLRVLGARHLVQAAGTRVLPAPLALVGGAGVDGLHAATALATGLTRPRRRRASLADAVVAVGWCAWGAVRARRLA
ncbi:hypothetical protein [uncultured Pseudokineococcus sp.]|uniref:hypothetical protein n=1 Tax=uncultured Pseudokineococcus sp. TaxID=1642928 RepID=UPI0026373D4A|nr:hypothetical protein [uncultured Pseudokineococcus sp.]